MNIIHSPATHSGHLERWLGREACDRLSAATRTWYGPPIAVAGVPGKVYAHKGGDLRGKIRTGAFASAIDVIDGWQRRIHRGLRVASRKSQSQLNAGFASLSDLISEATTGKSRYFAFNKVGSTGVVQVTNSLWRLGPQPPAGSAPANPAAGTAYNDASTGTFPFTNPTGGDTQHFVKGEVQCEDAGNTILLYDLLFGVNKTMNSTSTEAVTGVPTRYQSTTSTDADYIGGNFGFIQVGGTALAATGHNWTVCLYTDQANASSTLPSVTGNSAAIVDRLDQPVGQWFVPLESGDVGIKAWTQLQCSAAVATGVVWFMIGHPIAFMPLPAANIICVTDGIMTAFNLTRIFDDACLAFLEITKPSTSATTYSGIFQTVAG
jgi:hypothetical protein